MQDYIIKNAESNLENARRDWAQNHFVNAYQKQFDTEEAKLQVEATQKKMEEIEKIIAFVEEYIKLNR